jgi:hypothetical protein
MSYNEKKKKIKSNQIIKNQITMKLYIKMVTGDGYKTLKYFKA